ncbi:MAG: glutamate synthase subunit alpha, partial [Chthonomonadales bacterium]
MPKKTDGLYDPQFEHDACGVGFVANIKGVRSHDIVEKALQILVNLAHRGACGCDPETGDGAGILTQIPHTFFQKELGAKLPKAGHYGVGMVFLPQDANERGLCEAIINQAVKAEGQTLIAWRNVPVDSRKIGPKSREVEPVIRQFIVGRGANAVDDAMFERKLYVIRKVIEKIVTGKPIQEMDMFYISSLSSRTIVYKGLLMAHQIGLYYKDLANPAFTTALALVHQRFSTNTFPTWPLAHPYRYIAHNGEINTVRGNRNWMRAREAGLTSHLFGEDIKKLSPLVNESGSDSATLDSALELLIAGGRSLPHAMMMLVPEAWGNNEQMDHDRRAFYEYHACMMEPWDGPAAIAFTDGRSIGAILDRNGLRPARYLVTKDDLVVMASETGVLDIPAENIKEKWRLQPGKIFLVDTVAGKIISDDELKNRIIRRRPYGQWLSENKIDLRDLPEGD